MADKEGAALAERQEAQIELAMRAILDGEPLPQSGDPELVSRAILERIMAAETMDELLRPQALEPWREYLGRPAEVSGFHLNPSGYEQGSAVYAVVDLTWLDSGEAQAVSVGGRNVLVQLVSALRRGWLPMKVRLTDRQTGEGYRVLWLEPAS